MGVGRSALGNIPRGNDMTFIALYDFTALECEDLSFKKGDLLEVIETLKSGWWFAKSLSTNREGFIPSNFVMPGSDP